jgi:hypothetical protein
LRLDITDVGEGKAAYVDDIEIAVLGGSAIPAPTPPPASGAAVATDGSFVDLQGHWAKKDVEMMASRNLVNGVDGTHFAPDRQITRAEFAAMLVRSLTLAIGDKAPKAGAPVQFQDVQASDWFAADISAATRWGLINGYDDGTFKPNANVTREDAAVMLQRAVKLTGTDLVYGAKAIFKDSGTIHSWAQDAVSDMAKARIIEGMDSNNFAPQDQATRAQAAVSLKRLLQFVGFLK